MDYEGTTMLIPAYLKLIEIILFDEKMNYEEEITSSLAKVLQKKHPMIAIQTTALLFLKTFLSFSHGLPRLKVIYFDKKQCTTEMQHFTLRIIEMTNKFCDKQFRTLHSRNEDIAAEHHDTELNYGVKTLLFLIICYQATQDTDTDRNAKVQVQSHLFVQ